MDLIRYLKGVFITLSAVFMAGGLYLLLRPDVAATTICMTLGVLSILYGGVRLAGYFSNDLYRLAFQFDLAVGLLCILIGLILLLHPDRVLVYLPIVTGVFILVDSVLRLQTAADARRFGMSKWWVILISSLGGAVLGMFLLLRPFESGLTLVRLLGLTLLLDGGENLFIGLYTIKVPRRPSVNVIEGEFTLEGEDSPQT